MADWGELPVFSETVAWEDAQAELTAADLGDGLPLVPPTEARLAAMLADVDTPDQSHGQMPPLFGELTPATVAYQCVLAGALPAELPLVLAAAEACLEPQFNLLGVATTTGTPAVAVVVHGPLGPALGINDATNCLGPGNRANACIGRAVSLVLRNIGGARENVGDMATMGQPGKYTFCFAEHEEAVLPPLHQRRGFSEGSSAVTVLGVTGTAEVLPARPGETPEHVLRPVAALMQAARWASGGGRERDGGEQFLLLPAEPAQLIERHGWNLARIQGFLAEASRAPDLNLAPEDIHPIITGGAGVKMTYLPLWGGGTLSVTKLI